MKTIGLKRGNRGSVLVVTLVVTAILGFTLASYLTLISSLNRSTVRSQNWNSAIPIVEAGIEEALTHLNKNGMTNISADGWQTTNGGYTVSRYLGDSYYIATIFTNIPVTPDVVVTGYVPTPIVLSSGPGGMSANLLAAVGAGSSTNYVSRKVRVTTKMDSLFAKGMVAKGNINWVGNIESDSFDSSDPTYSTNGRYDVTKRKDNGSVASNSGTVSMGGGKIYGAVATGPTGSATGGTVGTAAYISGGGSGIQTGHYANDMNVSFPDVLPPFSGGYLTPVGGTISSTNYITTTNNTSSYQYPTNYVPPLTGVWTTNIAGYPTGSTYVTTNTVVTGNKAPYSTNFTYNATNWFYQTASTATNVTSTTYDYILDSGNYQMSSLSMSGQQKMLVRGNATFYVTGAIALTGQSQIDIAVGGNFKWYAGGAVALNGNGVFNANNDPLKFSMYGLPGATSVSFGGNASFTGTLYAPNASFSAGGGGSTVYDVVGAVIVKDVGMNGHFQFHYDENLGRNGPGRGYIITSWNEE